MAGRPTRSQPPGAAALARHTGGPTSRRGRCRTDDSGSLAGGAREGNGGWGGACRSRWSRPRPASLPPCPDPVPQTVPGRRRPRPRPSIALKPNFTLSPTLSTFQGKCSSQLNALSPSFQNQQVNTRRAPQPGCLPALSWAAGSDPGAAIPAPAAGLPAWPSFPPWLAFTL